LEFSGVRQFSVKNHAYPGTYQGMQGNMDRLVTTFRCPKGWEPLISGPDGETLAAKMTLENGEIIYLGGLPQELNGSTLWKSFILDEINPYETDRHLLSVSEGIVKYRRETADQVQLYLTNMTRTESEFTLLQETTDLLTGKLYATGNHLLDSYSYVILAFPKTGESDQ
jgi:beta-galactosidase